MGHSVVVDPTCHDALAALCGAGRRAPRRGAADGRGPARRARDGACAAATAGRGSSTGLDFAALAAREEALDGPQRFHGVPAGGARARRDGDLCRPDGRLRFRRADAFARSRSTTAAGLLGADTLRGRLSRSTGSDFERRRRAVGRQPRAWSRISSERRIFRRSTAASCFSRTSASIPTGSSGCSTSCHFAGVLARQRAVLLGAFNGYELGPNDNGYDAAAMVAHVRARIARQRLHRLAVRARSGEADAARRRRAARSTCAAAARRLVFSDYGP